MDENPPANEGGHGFDPWFGKIPPASEQLSSYAATTEARAPSTVLYNKECSQNKLTIKKKKIVQGWREDKGRGNKLEVLCRLSDNWLSTKETRVKVLVARSCPTLCDPMDSRAHLVPLSMEFSGQE